MNESVRRQEAQLHAILSFLEGQAAQHAARSRRNTWLLVGLLLVSLLKLIIG